MPNNSDFLTQSDFQFHLVFLVKVYRCLGLRQDNAHSDIQLSPMQCAALRVVYGLQDF